MYLFHSLILSLFLVCFSFSPLHAKPKKSQEKPQLIDLETTLSPCILETKKIHIPDYPEAFNPALVPWKDGWLMGCRVIKDQTKKGWHSYVAVLTLDKHFNPTSPVQLLDTRSMAPMQPTNSADPRLIWVGDTLYMLYSDTLSTETGPMIVRMWVAEVAENNGTFSLLAPERISRFPDHNFKQIEKNWTPFSYADQLLLAYHVVPHRILRPFLDGSERCEHICSTHLTAVWKFGEPRGGSPGLKLDAINGDYLTFFHGSLIFASQHSKGQQSLHYFMGAYRFSAEPPFGITHISATPIIGKGFYSGKQYKPYWRPVQAIFPSGFAVEGDHIWLAYGRQDHEIWIAKIDTKKLLESLCPVVSVEQ